MDGYKVMTYDEDELGTVKRREGRYLLVESGRLHHTTHALPTTFAEADDDAKIVRVSISKDLLHDSPAVHHDELDEGELDAYYGLAAGDDAPPTEGRGDLLPDDPAMSEEQQAMRSGIDPAPAKRVAIRDHLRPGGPDEHGAGRQIHQDYVRRGR
jgi:hypothetical protein